MNKTTDLTARVAAHKKGVLDFRKRLEALPVDSYSPHGKVDFLVLRSEIDGLDFDLRIIREESRNPDFYVSEAARGVTRHIGGRYQTAPRVAVPYDTRRASAIISALRSTPAMVAQAPTLLTEPVGEMADVAIERLQNAQQNDGELGKVLAPHVPDASAHGTRPCRRRSRRRDAEVPRVAPGQSAGYDGAIP